MTTYLTIILEVSDQHTHLGIIIHKTPSWLPHISDINIVTRALNNFMKCNLSKCSSQVKGSTYLTMASPQLEYVSDVWDPFHIRNIMELEKA